MKPIIEIVYDKNVGFGRETCFNVTLAPSLYAELYCNQSNGFHVEEKVIQPSVAMALAERVQLSDILPDSAVDSTGLGQQAVSEAAQQAAYYAARLHLLGASPADCMKILAPFVSAKKIEITCNNFDTLFSLASLYDDAHELLCLLQDKLSKFQRKG